jgi:uncharacterized glyoxalase superfamily protein PhnB
MQIQPYLFFNGRAEEAIDFYRTSLGAEVGMPRSACSCGSRIRRNLGW